MKKIISVKIDGNKILFQIVKKFLFSKKEYTESIDINKIKKIEKIYEPKYKHNNELELTGINFYQNFVEMDEVINKEAALEVLEDKNEDIQEIISRMSLLYQIPAYGYEGDMQELFYTLKNSLNMDNIEIIETFL